MDSKIDTALRALLAYTLANPTPIGQKTNIGIINALAWETYENNTTRPHDLIEGLEKWDLRHWARKGEGQVNSRQESRIIKHALVLGAAMIDEAKPITDEGRKIIAELAKRHDRELTIAEFEKAMATRTPNGKPAMGR